MRSYLLSWLARQYAVSDLQSFEHELPGPWLVWEAGPWRPPQADRTTLFGAGPMGRTPSGEALVLEVAPRTGRARFEGVRLGRGAENDLVVDDATLSRAHLLFRLGDGCCMVEDLGSSNGTVLDGKPLGGVPVLLASGACIEAGGVRFTFYDARGLRLRIRRGAA